mmetsp:Transcript_12640/g.22888  ORF Transcript_12640/g.22888 Transcript_12640/m.22888 type:complete len:134 (-) Transcript_12640:200-601(-)
MEILIRLILLRQKSIVVDGMTYMRPMVVGTVDAPLEQKLASRMPVRVSIVDLSQLHPMSVIHGQPWLFPSLVQGLPSLFLISFDSPFIVNAHVGHKKLSIIKKLLVVRNIFLFGKCVPFFEWDLLSSSLLAFV